MRPPLASPGEAVGDGGATVAVNRGVVLVLEQHVATRRSRGWLRLLVGAVALGWLGVTAACERRAADEAGRVGEDSGIKIGYAVEAPYAYVEDGVVTGENPMIAREVLERLRLRPEWVQVPFGELINALETRRIDVIAAGLFVTPDRAKRVAFSLPTTQVYPGVLISGSRVCEGGALAWVVRERPRLAVLHGSVEEAWLLAQVGSTREVVRVPDARTGAVAVETGIVDGLLLSLPSVREQVRVRGGAVLQALALQGETDGVKAPTVSDVAFAFRPADRGTLVAWNRVLASFLGSPAHLALEERFGFVEAGNGTTKEEGHHAQ